MIARRAYPTDISDARWALTLLAWQQARLDRRPTGEPARTDVREVLIAFVVVRRRRERTFLNGGSVRALRIVATTQPAASAAVRGNGRTVTA